jgi:hypothetical protein
MLEEILVKLKKQNPDLACWSEGLKEESFDTNTLILSVPNQYYVEKYENGYKNIIEEIASKMLGRKIYVQLELQSEIEIVHSQKTETAVKTELKKFDGNPNFRDKAELEGYVKLAKIQPKIKKVKESEIKIMSMPQPYSIEKVVCFNTLIGQFFTTPSDRRKSAKVRIKINCQNDGVREYNLYRGRLIENDDGNGQLTTTHAKILLAIIHLWQKQSSQFIDDKEFFSIVTLSLKDLLQSLGYKKISGADYKRILQRLRELRDIPNLLVDGNDSGAFTFISDILTKQTKKQEKGHNKTILKIYLSPFVSKQLYERRAFYRNPELYQLKNPLAIKVLLAYDRMIIKGNRIQRTIKEIAKDLQIEVMRKDNIVRYLKGSVRELNGYELNDQYSLKAGVIKIGKDWTLIAERVPKVTNILQIANQKAQIALN